MEHPHHPNPFASLKACPELAEGVTGPGDFSSSMVPVATDVVTLEPLRETAP